MQWQLRKWKDLEERVEDLDEKRLWNSETERMPHQSIGISLCSLTLPRLIASLSLKEKSFSCSELDP